MIYCDSESGPPVCSSVPPLYILSLSLACLVSSLSSIMSLNPLASCSLVLPDAVSSLAASLNVSMLSKARELSIHASVSLFIIPEIVCLYLVSLIVLLV